MPHKHIFIIETEHPLDEGEPLDSLKRKITNHFDAERATSGKFAMYPQVNIAPRVARSTRLPER